MSRFIILGVILALLLLLPASIVGGADAGENCAKAGEITGNGLHFFDTRGASSDDPCQLIDVIIPTVWFRFTAPSPGVVELDVECAEFDAYLIAFEGPLCPTGCSGVVGQSTYEDRRVTFKTERWMTYYIAIRGWGGADEGRGFLRFNFTPAAGDTCDTAIEVSGDGVYPFDTTDASSDDPCLMLTVIIPTIWYRYTAPANGVIEADLCDSTFRTMLTVFRGPRCPVGCQNVVAENHGACAEQSAVRFEAKAGETYYFCVRGLGGADFGSGFFTLKFTPHPADPGDINGDGIVNVADLTLLARMLADGVRPLEASADLNDDGTVCWKDVEELATRIVE